VRIGKKIFYDKITGEKIVDTGEYHDVVFEKTIEQQIQAYTSLSERNRDTFDVLELPFGAYAQDLRSNGYRERGDENASLVIPFECAWR
jgi:hypothetical protein